jgi:CRISPR-associated protein Csb2
MSTTLVRLRISFDLGRYHATPWGAHVNDGEVEWPPSPWRLVRALLAVSRTHVELADLRPALDRGLQALIDAPPPSYVLPPSRASHTRHFVPSRKWSPTASNETDLLLDGFRALDPDTPLEAWWRADLEADELAALSETARRLAYLGRSESLCTATLQAATEPACYHAVPLSSGEPGTGELRELLGFEAGATLEDTAGVSVTQLRREHRREPALTRRVTYAVSEPLDPAPLRCAPDGAARPTLARLRIVGGDRPGLHEAIVVAEVARRALQSVYGRANQNATSTVFSGRDGERMRTDQHAHAHYLVTSDPGSARVDHLTVWAPEGFGPNEVAALAQVTELRDARAWPEPLRIALTALGTPDSLPLPDLCAHTNRWRTLTPIVLTRHAKRRGGQTIDGPAEQIARELQLRGLPPATRITRTEGAWHEFRARRPTGRRPVPAALLGARIELAAPARGPIALGALAHFGLGLLVPDA